MSVDPTWQSDCGRVRLFHADCVEVLRSLDRGIADAVVTDPPYCSGGATEAAKGRSTHQGLRTETIASGRFGWFDSDNMTTAGLCELLRSVCVHAPIRDDGSVLAFCDWRMVSSLSPAMESAGLRLRNILVWDKGHFGCGTGFRPRHEMVLHLSKRSPVFYNASVGNVLTYSRESEREHPTQKPVELMKDLLSVVLSPYGLAVDPFMGSGTTGVAAIEAGGQFIGIERDPAYFDIAKRRIQESLGMEVKGKDGTTQKRLFADVNGV